MKFLFDDATFSFETLRTTGFANYFGADLGEVLATARRIYDGDQGSWHREWQATAGRVAELGERSPAPRATSARSPPRRWPREAIKYWDWPDPSGPPTHCASDGGNLTTVVVPQELQVQKLLGIPDFCAIAAMLALGKPARRIAKLHRKTVGEIATRERFDGPAYTLADQPRDDPDDRETRGTG